MNSSIEEEWISYLEDRVMEINQAEQKREKGITQQENRCREIYDIIKYNNIHNIGVPEAEEKKRAVGLFKQIIYQNFLSLGKDTDVKTQEAQRMHIKFNKSQPSSRYTIVKFSKYIDKERILKAYQDKKSFSYGG